MDKSMKIEKNRKIFSDRKGFTLLELMAVIAIVSIIAAVSFAMLAGSKNDANAKAACNELAGLINKTRSYALSGKMVSGSVPDSFSIKIENGSKVTIDGDPAYNLRGGVICDNRTIKYNIPDGGCASGCSASINCTVSGKTHTITMDNYKAVCN